MVRELFEEFYEDRIEIWQESFGDERSYIEMFLSKNRQRARVFGYLVEDQLVSVAYLLPAEYVEKEKEVPVYYLYAAATRKAYRGKGYFGQILCFVRDNLKQPIFLVPADKKLIEFYAHYGMKQIMEQKNAFFSKMDVNYEACLEDISVSEYFRLRNQCFSDQGFVRWNQEILQYILQENEYCGGICKKLCVNNDEIPVIMRKNGEMLEVLEIVAQEDLAHIAMVLCDKMNCRECSVQIQPDVMAYSKDINFSEQIYFNLCMG